jgi:hypothetical protein
MAVTGDQQVLANLEKWAEERQAAAVEAMEIVMEALANWAKTEHSYTDRTSATTTSISGKVAEASKEIVRGVLSAGMEYDVFLELARNGKWAFLWPTIVRHEQDIIQLLKTRLGEGSVGTSLSRSGSLAKDYENFKANQRRKRQLDAWGAGGSD